ncbi:MAG: thioredoxin family protein [Flammeovirgaceae bacterium]
MKKLASFGVFTLILFLCSAWIIKPESGEEKKEAKIKWMTVEEAFAATQKKPKKIFIDVYTDWCGWCKKMDRDTFEKAEVAEYMNEHFYAVKFNAEQKEDIVLGDQTFKFINQGRRGYHQLAAALMNGKMSYPTVVVLNEKFQMLQPIPGYRAPAEMKKVLEFFAQNKHLQKKAE